MTRLVLGLLRPYRGWLAIVFIAMLVEIATSLAAPWPLKLVLDDALGKHHLPHWLAWAHDYGFGRHTLGVALFAGAATLVLRSSVRLRRRECPSQQLRGWNRKMAKLVAELRPPRSSYRPSKKQASCS